MPSIDALLILLDRYLAWGRIDDYRNLSEAVTAFRTEQGERATRESRDAIDWVLGDLFPDGEPIDSLDLVELIMETEERYGRKIGDEDAAALPESASGLTDARRALPDSSAPALRHRRLTEPL